MKYHWVVCLAVGATIVVSAPASALKLTNMDKRSYDVSIKEGGKSKMHRIEAGATLDKLCSDNGCTVHLVDVPDGDYVMEGNEQVNIERGLVFYAEPYINKEGPDATIKDVTKDGTLKTSPKTKAPDKN